MALILCIETGTDICSVGIARDGELISLRESDEGRDHARQVGVFVDELLEEMGLQPDELDAIAVGKGPGSYTGLRIGVSFSKGLCYGIGKPLLAIGSLDALTEVAREDYEAGILDVDGWEDAVLCPMVDARRMEVYTAVFENGRQITETAPAIIDENSFAEYLEQGPCLFIGDGAGKCADVIKHPDATFRQCWPKASSMVEPALAAYHSGDFKDVANFGPFYLKEFVATVSKKMW